MSEYSIYFNPPGFNDYPRTVKDTVNYVAINAHVERDDVENIYVLGSETPSSDYIDKIWVHDPESTIEPPDPVENPALPTPQPLTYFPGTEKSISTLASLNSPGPIFNDSKTGDTWSFGIFNNQVTVVKIDSSSNISAVNFPPGYGGIDNVIGITKTPSGRLFVLSRGLQTTPLVRAALFLFEIVNNVMSFVSQYVSPLTNPYDFDYTCTQLTSDSLNNLYFTTKRIDTYRPEIFKISVPNMTFSILSYTYPTSLARDFYALGIVINSTGNLILVVATNTDSITNVAYVLTGTLAGGLFSIQSGPHTNQINTSGKSAIGIDTNDNIYISTIGNTNMRIKRITSAGTVSVYAGTGVPGFLDGPLLKSQFYYPGAVHFSASGNLYISDVTNNKIRSTSGVNSSFSTVSNSTYVGLNINRPASIQITATQSPTIYTATNLPTGLSVNGSTGLITGTPTVNGIYSSVVSASNSFGGSSKGIIFQVFSDLPTDYFNSRSLRGFANTSWYEFSTVLRGDIILVPEEQIVLFPWGESDKSYDMSPWGQPTFTVPILPTPPLGFKYKYYIGLIVSQSAPPVITP
jgi:hypothetical protein